MPAVTRFARGAETQATDCLALFYESFSCFHSYTTLGQINDSDILASALGRGSVEVTFQTAHKRINRLPSLFDS